MPYPRLIPVCSQVASHRSLSKGSLRASKFTSVFPIPLYVPYTDPTGVDVFIRLGVLDEEY